MGKCTLSQGTHAQGLIDSIASASLWVPSLSSLSVFPLRLRLGVKKKRLARREAEHPKVYAGVAAARCVNSERIVEYAAVLLDDLARALGVRQYLLAYTPHFYAWCPFTT